ncbi:hypothetical protein AAF712_009126 [Marasmius tenuissimus]|uniref:Uncharacterized protein n=1 Tax=Marasmius tenuissimus TaxID=585030 RepID=A0ABR2ZQI2_9AGAR
MHSCPPLENLLKQALEREDQPIYDSLEEFDEITLSQSAPAPRLGPFNKRPINEEDASQPKKSQNTHRHVKRRKRREEQLSTDGHLHSHHLPAIQTCQTVSSSLNVAKLPVANGGFIGQDVTGSSRNVHHSTTWNGMEGTNALLLVDEAQRIFLVGLKRVNDSTYDEDMIKAADLLEAARKTKLVLKKEDLTHLRGQGFAAAATGWSMGGGQDKVTHSAGKHEEVMQGLIVESCIRRLASMQDGTSSYLPFFCIFTLVYSWLRMLVI